MAIPFPLSWNAVALASATAAPQGTPAPAAAPRSTLSACAAAGVTVDGALAPAWASEVSRVCEALPSWHDADRTAQLRVSEVPSGLEIRVALGDGRDATREVHDPSAILLTVEALVTLPRVPPEPEPVANVSHGPPPSSSLPPAAAPAPQSGPVITVEFFGAAVGRVSGRPTYLSSGFAAGADLAIGHWMFGLVARWDGWQVPEFDAPPGFEMDTLGAGFSVTRRACATRLCVDGGISTTFVTESQSVQSTSGERASSTTDSRLGVLGRAYWGRSALRPMVLVEGEVSPARLKHTLRLDDQLPPLPAWSVGLGIGVSWEAP